MKASNRTRSAAFEMAEANVRKQVECKDDRAEIEQLIETEIGALLASHGYHDACFVFGSALKALAAAERGDLGGADVQCIVELVNALDSRIPDPVRDYDAPFMMPVEGVHTIAGRGTVVSGRVERGVIRVGDCLEIVGLSSADDEQVVVTGVQSFHKDVAEARAGMNVGLLLRGVKRDDVVRGQVVVKPGALKPYRTGRAQIFVLSKDEGGRHTPFGSGYQPQFFFGPTDVTGVVRVDTETGVVEPGAQAMRQRPTSRSCAHARSVNRQPSWPRSPRSSAGSRRG